MPVLKHVRTPLQESALPCSRRLEILSDADKQYIHFQIKRDSLMRTGDICELLDKPVSVSTVAHVLKRYGYGCWNAQKTL